MSVINKMLKDLDKRQQPHGIESMAAPRLAFKPKASSKRVLLLTSIISLAIGGAAVFFGLSLMQTETVIAKTVKAETGKAETGKAETGKAETGIAETGKAETGIAETGKAETGKAETGIAETGKAETGIAETGKAETGIAETVKAETGKAETGVAKTVKAETVKAETVKAETGIVETGKAETVKAETATAETEAVNTIVAETATAETEAVNTIVAKTVKAETGTAFTEAVNTAMVKSETSPSEHFNIAPATKRSKQLHSSGNMAVKEVKLSPEELAQKQMLLATDAQQQGLHRDALTYYEAALAYNPSLHQARRQAAALYYGQSKLAKAAKLLEQGQLLFPQEYEFSLLLARVQQAGGQAEQALKSLAKIPDSSELAIKKWHQQSDLAQQQKNYPVAEQSFRQLAKYEPNQGRWWMGLGYALDAQQKYTEAKSAYSQALSQGNLSAQAKVYLDNRLLQLGAY